LAQANERLKGHLLQLQWHPMVLLECGADMSLAQRANSLPDLGTSQPPAKRGAAELKGWLPLLDRRTQVYGVCYETVRRHEVKENMEHFRAEGNLPKLWSAVRRAQLDAQLCDTPSVNDMAHVLAKAARLRLICESVARRAATASFATKDVRVLEAAIKELEELRLGPKLWKDPMYPLLHCIPILLPHLEKLRQLAQEHKAAMKPGVGCARFCTAWLAAVKSGELRLASAIEAPRSDFQGELEMLSTLEVSTARWLLAFPDAMVELGLLVSDDVKAEYWRLTDCIEGKSWKTDGGMPADLSPENAHLAKVLVLAGSLANPIPRSADAQPQQDERPSLTHPTENAIKPGKPKSCLRKPKPHRAAEDANLSGKPKPRSKCVEDVKL